MVGLAATVGGGGGGGSVHHLSGLHCRPVEQSSGLRAGEDVGGAHPVTVGILPDLREGLTGGGGLGGVLSGGGGGALGAGGSAT